MGYHPAQLPTFGPNNTQGSLMPGWLNPERETTMIAPPTQASFQPAEQLHPNTTTLHSTYSRHGSISLTAMSIYDILPE